MRREFTRELLREINWSTKIVALVLGVALVGGVLYLGNALYDEMRRGRDAHFRMREEHFRGAAHGQPPLEHERP